MIPVGPSRTNISNRQPAYSIIADAGDEGFGDFAFILRR